MLAARAPHTCARLTLCADLWARLARLPRLSAQGMPALVPPSPRSYTPSAPRGLCSFGWHLQRDSPPPSPSGSPSCSGSVAVALAPASGAALQRVLRGEAQTAELLRRGGGEGSAAEARAAAEGSAALCPLAWRASGDLCVLHPLVVQPGSEPEGVAGAPPGPRSLLARWRQLPWGQRAAPGLALGSSRQLGSLWVACNASLLAEPGGAGGGAPWWRLDCSTVAPDGTASGDSCEGDYCGPRYAAHWMAGRA